MQDPYRKSKWKSAPPSSIRLLQLVTINYAVVPFFLLGFFLFQDVDTVYVFGKLVAPYFPPIPPAIFVFLRRSCNLLYATDGPRLFVFLMLYAFLRILLFKSYITKLATILTLPGVQHLTKRLQIMINYYSQMSVINRHEDTMFSNLFGAFFLAEFFLSTILYFVTIRMHSVFPPLFYIVFPAFGVVAAAVLEISLPLLIGCGVDSQDVLDKMAAATGLVSLLRGMERKWVQKRLKAMKNLPVAVGFGGVEFFKIRSETKATFYWVILNNTINLLMSVDV